MSGILQGLIASYPPPVPGVTYATWNPSDKSANITLSNGNLTASNSQASSFAGVKSTIGKSSGKWYWEISNWAPPGGDVKGIANSSSNVNAAANDGNCCVVRFQLSGSASCEIWDFGTYSAAGSFNVTSNSITGFALDMDNRILDVYINGILAKHKTGIPANTYFATMNFWNTASSTANFGATTMAYTAPSGYNQGLYN